MNMINYVVYWSEIIFIRSINIYNKHKQVKILKDKAMSSISVRYQWTSKTKHKLSNYSKNQCIQF